MTDNTPSSLICFKNGYSYVNIPVNLTSDEESTAKRGIKECQVGPLPNFAVHGTVSLAPHNPAKVKIFSLSQAAKKIIKPNPLKIEKSDYSYESILEENIGTAVRLVCLTQNGNGKPEGTQTFEGIIKSVHKNEQQKENGLVVLKSLYKNDGEKMIRCSSIAHLETIQIKDQPNGGIIKLGALYSYTLLGFFSICLLQLCII